MTQGEGFRPAAGKRHPGGILVPEGKSPGNTKKERQPDAQGSEDNMEGQRRAHLGARRQEI